MIRETVYALKITNKKPKFKIGNRVRLSKFVNKFENKLKTN